MRVKKTSQSERAVYRYPVSVEDGNGGYKVTYNEIKPGVDGVTEIMIHTLHQMDDNEVYNNVKNARPKMTAEEKAAKKEWEDKHLGEEYPDTWNYSIDCLMEYGDKSNVLATAAVDPFEEVSDEVEKLREIVATKMTDRQRQAYELIGLQEYSITDAAKVMGVSIKVAKVHYDKAIDCIRKNF